jgi:hypothetical protein
MLDSVKTSPVAAGNYHTARSNFAKTLRAENPSADKIEQLRNASQQFKHPLAMTDTLHLMALGELAGGRNAWAQSLLLQAIELTKRSKDDFRAADLWLMVAINSTRSGDTSTASTAWKNSVIVYSKAQLASNRPLNTSFWVRADRNKPAKTEWPDATKHALTSFAKPVGCKITSESANELVIWAAVGNAQLDGGEAQLALVNFKKAETFASGEDALWLRIAQSECLAALGQNRAAAALLSEPLVAKHPKISAAANAALGSGKLQAGTYQQGAQILNKALSNAASLEWPSKNKAEADLALAMLIIGDTDNGLKTLHTVQKQFESQGDLLSLLQSLENEMQLLEYEGSTDAANKVRQRILQIESRQAS